MKKKLLSAFIAILLVTTIFVTVGFADFGDYAGGSDWSFDSGSSWGSGYDWGSSSWDSDDDFYIFGGDYSDHNSSGGSGSVGETFMTALIVIVIIAVVIASSRRKGAARPQSRPVNLGQQPTSKPLVNHLDELKAKDSSFSESKFLDDVSNLYVRMQNCWTDKNLEPVRPQLTPELFAKSDRQLAAYRSSGQTNRIERISVLDTRIVGCDSDDTNDIITVQLTSRIVDYVVKDSDGSLVRGDRNKELFMTYQWTFLRSLGKKTQAESGVDSKHCPNCGAPIDLNRSAVCGYCGATVTDDDYDWVLSNIRGISQRSGQ